MVIVTITVNERGSKNVRFRHPNNAHFWYFQKGPFWGFWKTLLVEPFSILAQGQAKTRPLLIFPSTALLCGCVEKLTAGLIATQ